MINLKISALVDATEVLQKLAQKSLKAKVAFQVSRLLKEADKEVKEFNDTRIKLINKYGEKDETGELKVDETGNCRIPPESMTEFNNEMSELLNSEIEINANKLNFDDLGDVEFTPSEVIVLEPFVEME